MHPFCLSLTIGQHGRIQGFFWLHGTGNCAFTFRNATIVSGFLESVCTHLLDEALALNAIGGGNGG
jgi:hypothetical protein